MNSPMLRRFSLVLALLVILAAAPGCDSDSPTAPLLTEGDVTFDQIYASDTSALVDAVRSIVRTPTAFTDLQSDIFIDPDAEALEDVDFNQLMVLAVASGEQPEACYSIEVTSVTSDGTDMTVRVTETGPDSDCVCAQSLVQPVQLVTVPRADEVSFFTETATDCPI